VEREDKAVLRTIVFVPVYALQTLRGLLGGLSVGMQVTLHEVRGPFAALHARSARWEARPTSMSSTSACTVAAVALKIVWPLHRCNV
jgi:hypothetical protein